MFLFAGSCASTGSFNAIDGELGYSRYAESIALLEKNKKFLYSNRDTVLYCLDKGMLSHYAQLYADSSRLLEDGERAIEEAFTKSVTQEISAFLINDNARDYGGEDYEDIYINVFNALNYHHRGEPEGAMVEIRRMNSKLEYLAFKYDASLARLRKKAQEDSSVSMPPEPARPAQFSNSALARYLGMLFYRGAGLHDSARIDRDWLRAAFAGSPAVYKQPVPSSISGELAIPEGMARLNVLSFAGLSPVKREAVMRLPIGNGRWIKIALPEMASRRSSVSRAEIVFENGNAMELELLEDIDAVAKETFKFRQRLVYLKTVIRATAKSVTSSAFMAAAREADGDAGLIYELISIAAQFFAELSEQADLRVSRYFPAKAYIGGINLPPGSYSFQVKFYGKNGREIDSVWFREMIVREGALNLAEAVCLK